MAKKQLKKKTVIIPVQEKEPEIIPEVREEIVPAVIIPKVDETELTVFSLSEAEFYQKSGLRLISVSRSGFNKVYKFERGK